MLVETSALREQMRDIQASVTTIESKSFRLSSFFGGKFSKLDLGSEEYQNELKILADKINHTNGIDFHTETYALGEKILSDAAGTADGALKAHYDRITTMKKPGTANLRRTWTFLSLFRRYLYTGSYIRQYCFGIYY